MYTRAQALASGSPVLNLSYLKPTHSLTPKEAFDVAKKIRSEFLTLKNFHSLEVCKITLKEKYSEFSSPTCFPTLFELACEEEGFEAVEALVELRTRVNEGSIKEEEGALEALKIAALQKSKLS